MPDDISIKAKKEDRVGGNVPPNLELVLYIYPDLIKRGRKKLSRFLDGHNDGKVKTHPF